MSGVELTPVCTVWARQSPDAPTTPRDWVSNSPQRRWESGAPARPAAVRNRGVRALTHGHLRRPVLLGSWTQPTALVC